MRLCLINPGNPLVSLAKVKESRWNKYRVWKPLSLLSLAGLTSSDWDIKVVDENCGVPDYASLPRPDLVGITAFSSQAPRAYQLAEEFRRRGIAVVMGGIHATMCLDEAQERVDAVVTGEAENVWATVLEDARKGALKRVYQGTEAAMDKVPVARHDLLSTGYRFGSIQTTRGCPLSCSFCSVPAFNGKTYRFRPVEQVVKEFQLIREKLILITDDNLIGIHRDHFDRAKDLFKTMIRADLGKQWVGQVSINVADDEEVLRLAKRSGCIGLFIGLESPTEEGLAEVNKKFNTRGGRNLKASVQRIQRQGIAVAGSFIIGLDADQKGIGRKVAAAAQHYGVDLLNVLFLTPLPGTRLWNKMETENRIALHNFPEDWKYFTLTYPVARYRNLSRAEIFAEVDSCNRDFYSSPRIFYRLGMNLWHSRNPFLLLVSNLSYRKNHRLDQKAYKVFSQAA